MIIHVEGSTAANVEAARHGLDELARGWGHETATTSAHPPDVAGEGRDDDKSVDPVALSALVVSIPSAALAVFDLADRIQKRRRAKELLDHARQLVARQVTVRLVSQSRRIELANLNPDQLLELLATENAQLED